MRLSLCDRAMHSLDNRELLLLAINADRPLKHDIDLELDRRRLAPERERAFSRPRRAGDNIAGRIPSRAAS